MAKARVHLLAKELGLDPKDLIAHLEKMGMRGRKAQSSLEDDEVARIRAALEAPRAAEDPGRELVLDDADRLDRVHRARERRAQIRGHERQLEGVERGVELVTELEPHRSSEIPWLPASG